MLWERKTQAVFDHIFASYRDDGSSVYDEDGHEGSVATVIAPPPIITEVDVSTITEAVLTRIRSDPALAEAVAQQLRGVLSSFVVPTAELIAGDETGQVEFGSTARWNLVEARKDKRMEDAVVKTIAGFLNADGGTLLIGVADNRHAIGCSTTCRM